MKCYWLIRACILLWSCGLKADMGQTWNGIGSTSDFLAIMGFTTAPDGLQLLLKLIEFKKVLD